ncbi:hypothetical protein BH10BAC1_BH10BAC1_09340 [soil metagenome]
MKTRSLKFSISIFIFLVAGLFTNQAKAQVNVNINISSQALWGPVGYDYVEYYYLPEPDVFYYVATGQFIYWSGGQQFFVYSLPSSYTVNLYSTYKVVVNTSKPYKNHGYYVSHYAKYKHGGYKQGNIRDSDDEKYYKVKGHPKYGKEKGNKGGTKQNQKTNTPAQKKEAPQKAPQQKQQKSKQAPQQKQQQKQQQQPKQQSAPKGQKSSGGHGGKGH